MLETGVCFYYNQEEWVLGVDFDGVKGFFVYLSKWDFRYYLQTIGYFFYFSSFIFYWDRVIENSRLTCSEK